MIFESKISLNRLVAYFAHPYLDLPLEITTLNFNKEEENQLYYVSKSNKVLLRFIGYADSKEFLIKSNILSDLVNRNVAFKESYNYAKSLTQELVNVIAKFNEHSIDTIFIKSLNTLPLDSDNFDIIVRQQDLAASITMLKEAGFTEVVWVREPYKWLFRYVKDGKDHLAVHIHTAVAWEGVEFVDLAALWEGRQKLRIQDVTVGVPSPEHHMLITIAHAFFENHQFSLSDLTYITEDIYSKEIDWDYLISWTTNEFWVDIFYEMLLLTDHTYRNLFGDSIVPDMILKKIGPNKMNNYLTKKLVMKYDKKQSLPIRIPIVAVANNYIRKIGKENNISSSKRIEKIFLISKDFLKRRMPIREDRPALSIYFVGQDGTGKTIHAKYIWKEIQHRKIRVKYVWSRGTGFFLGPFLNLLRSALLNGKTLKEHKNSSKSTRTMLDREPLKSIWAYLLIANHLAKSIKVKLAVAFGNIVICDRTVFDTFVDVECDLGKRLSKILKTAVEQLAPKPAIIFMMDTPPKELVKRRPKLKLDLVKKKRSAYFDNLSTKDKLNIIDTNDDLQKNRAIILTNTLQVIYSHHRKKGWTS